ASLNPRMTVRQIVSEPLRSYKMMKGKKMRERVLELMSLVSLDPSMINRYPHEFSGGQRQRIGTARALALNPSMIICDEPISALDVSIQAQVVNLLKDLQNKLGHTYLFISHDLSMVRYICDRVAVMYLGVLAEMAQCNELYTNPLHPYTQALLSAVPVPDPNIEKDRQQIILSGDVPSPSRVYPGCKFFSRCGHSKAICAEVRPEFREVDSEHYVACHMV
ncbi:MAG: oligopeptide/dipeptide ABC transporter ATP-binding protein, partial [Brevefilum sp.]